MPFRKGYSTTIKLILSLLFLLNNVSMQQLPVDTDLIHLSGPAGMVTSPGYPETPAVSIIWNITVNEDHRILLQVLDFELVERNPCSLDVFEMYDGVFVSDLLRGRWCWDSFDKLTLTTYISNSNIFLLRLRTVDGFSRKGFRANYSSIPKEVTTTSTVNFKQTTTPSGVLLTHTTSTRNAPGISTMTDVLNITPTTTVGENIPPSTKSSIQTGTIIAIATSMIVAFIVIFIAALIVRKYRINNLSKDSSDTKLSKPQSGGNIITDMYDVVTEEVHDIKSDYENTNLKEREEKTTSPTDISLNVQQVGVYSKEIVREGDIDTPDGTYETPDVKVYSYADPNEMKFCVAK